MVSRRCVSDLAGGAAAGAAAIQQQQQQEEAALYTRGRRVESFQNHSSRTLYARYMHTTPTAFHRRRVLFNVHAQNVTPILYYNK